MDLFGFGEIAGSLIDFGSAMWQTDKQADMADHAMDFTRDQTRAQMDFQERMRSTQYQTAIGDMKAAGLNPMLAYSQGGAGTPSGSAGSGAMGAAGRPMPIGAAATAAQIGVLQAQAQNIDKDTELKDSQIPINRKQLQVMDNTINLLQAQAKQTDAYRQLNDSERLKVDQTITNLQQELINLRLRGEQITEETLTTLAERFLIKEKTKNVAVDRVLQQLDVPKAVNEAMAQFSTYMREIAPYTGELGRITGSAESIRRAIKPGRGITIQGGRK